MKRLVKKEFRRSSTRILSADRALETHFEKWLYLLRHLPELRDPPPTLQESIFLQLFEVAEIANFSWAEQESYQNSLKHFRDLNNVVDTSRQEGRQEGLAEGLMRGREEGLMRGREEGLIRGREEGREEGVQMGAEQERSRLLDRQRSLLLRQLSRQFGELPEGGQVQVNQLSLAALEALGETFLAFAGLEELRAWLAQPPPGARGA